MRETLVNKNTLTLKRFKVKRITKVPVSPISIKKTNKNFGVDKEFIKKISGAGFKEIT